MKQIHSIQILIFFILLTKINYIYCDNVCTVWLNPESTNTTSPCGLEITTPCQNFEAAVSTCGSNYDVMNLNFMYSEIPYQISQQSPLNTIDNNKTINLININQTSIEMDLSNMNTSLVNIENDYNTSNNYQSVVNVSGFTFTNFQSGIFRFVKTFLNLTITNCNFKNLNSTSSSSVLFYYNSNTNNNNNIYNNFLIINNSIFQNIQTGGLFLLEQINVVIDNTVFEEITSNYSPHSIMNLDRATTMKFTNSKIINCKSNTQGTKFSISIGYQTTETSLLLPQPSLVFENITLRDNLNGDIIALSTGKSYIISMNQITAENNYYSTPIYFMSESAMGGGNSSALDGASIFIVNLGSQDYPFSLSINNCSFTDNNSTRYGGSIYMNSVNSITITNSTFNNNTVDNSYGGNQIYCSSSNVTIQNSNIVNSGSSTNVTDNNQVACKSSNSCSFKNSDPDFTDFCTPPTDSSNSNSTDHGKSNSKPLTTGQKAGIAIGVIAFCLITTIAIIFIVKRKRTFSYKSIY
ncbi:hypothetical protein DICPUDRAFT_158074 [Dictyostelium purpureum]|uniref:Right handed beta helix domain-containing protein n=1 Tax=Dictyostelium purpureum TaxID=5786 RepID=F1A0R9_DICPU|nr:uncharacterized protein DICPUDRAFT_158074 [Dictyostelium purpureum]EGC30207.1 hypothetical protein DICPUDRAFT_158074 [Dictyostelium purpureum]|eukprot:XP_003293270.1 hypothetical protein DICPUDRAFT_158074 [Dictyostelium purpureum]